MADLWDTWTPPHELEEDVVDGWLVVSPRNYTPHVPLNLYADDDDEQESGKTHSWFHSLWQYIYKFAQTHILFA